MEGIPPEDARDHERQKYGGKGKCPTVTMFNFDCCVT